MKCGSSIERHCNESKERELKGKWQNAQEVNNELQYVVCFFSSSKSKHGRESPLYCSDFDEPGAVEKLGISTFQRRYFHQNPSNIRSIHGQIEILGHFLPFSNL